MTTAEAQAYAGERAIDDRFTRLINYCRAAVPISPADLERIERIKLLLVARGVEPEDEAAAAWLSPALCTNAEEQRHFLQRFEEYRRRPLDEAKLEEEQRTPDLAASSSRMPAFLRREAALFAAAPAAILLILLIGQLIGWGDEATPDGGNNVAIGGGARVPVGGPQAEMQLEPSGPGVAVLILAAVAALGLFQWMRQRRQRLLEDFEPAPQAAAATVLARDTALFAAPWLARTFGMLRRHKETPSRRIDARRTIRATVRSGGRPEIRFGSRPATPEYLLLVDRQSPRDHLLVVGDALQQQFAKEGIVASRYDHVGKADRLRPVPAVDGRPVPLADAAALHEGARVIALAEARDCAGEAGEATPWPAMFAQLDQPTLFDPRRPRRWTGVERQLEESGVLVVPATPEGLGWYAEAVNLRGLKWPGRWPASNRFEEDPVDSFLSDKRALLDDQPPPPERIAELMIDLRHSLGQAGFRLLSAAAVYPAVDPAFTLHVAASLDSPKGGPLLTEATWLAVARLPWMRLGHLPQWLRAELIRGLDAQTLLTVSALVQAYVLPKISPQGTAEPDLEGAADERRRVQLLNWIGRNPESELYDPLLFDALRGVPPGRIGARDPDKPGRSLSLWRVQDSLVAAALAAALAALAWTNPPLVESPAEPDPIAQADENVSALDSNAIEPLTNAIEPVTNTAGPAGGASDPTDNGIGAGNATITGGDGSGNGNIGSEGSGSGNSKDPATEATEALPLPGEFIIFFDWNSAKPSEAAGPVIASIASAYSSVAATRQLAILLSCYSGSEPNMGERLARLRCNQVRSLLKASGVPLKAIHIYVPEQGQDRPLVPTAEGVREPQARRVEVSFFDPSESGK